MKTKSSLLTADRYFILDKPHGEPRHVFLIQRNDEGHIFQCPAKWSPEHRAYVITGFGWNEGHTATMYPQGGHLDRILKRQGFKYHYGV